MREIGLQRNIYILVYVEKNIEFDKKLKRNGSYIIEKWLTK